MTSSNTMGRQRGLVMIIALIMLLAVTLMVVTSSNLVQANLKVVQNLESREQVRSAALGAVEEAISDIRFTSNPKAIFNAGSPSCQNVADPDDEEIVGKCYFDSNVDGENDVTVDVIEPRCISFVLLKNSELDVYANPKDRECHTGTSSSGAVATTSGDNAYSWCGAAVWEFEVTATDDVTGAEVTMRQGVSVKTTKGKIEQYCPISGEEET